MTNDELLHKWVHNTLSKEELKIFEQRPEYESLILLYKNTEGLKGPSFDSESILQEILAQPKTNTSKDVSLEQSDNIRKLNFPQWIKYGIAASLVFVAAYFLIPADDFLVNQIALDNPIEGTLPDNSSFILNTGSSLSYSSENWQKKRIIDLEGEAYFEVTKGATFTVQTSIGQVQVLGTQFNVRSHNGGLEVICKEGLVMVTSNDGLVKERLSATDALKIRPTGEVLKWNDISQSGISWTNGITQLKDVSLKEVIVALEKQFKITIEVENVNLDDRLSCSFQHTDLELALKTATAPLSLKWEIDKKIVRLFK